MCYTRATVSQAQVSVLASDTDRIQSLFINTWHARAGRLKLESLRRTLWLWVCFKMRIKMRMRLRCYVKLCSDPHRPRHIIILFVCIWYKSAARYDYYCSTLIGLMFGVIPRLYLFSEDLAPCPRLSISRTARSPEYL